MPASGRKSYTCYRRVVPKPCGTGANGSPSAIWNSASANATWHSANVNAIWNSAIANAIGNNANVNDIWNSASASPSVIWNSASTNECHMAQCHWNSSSANVVDRPTQLISISDIYLSTDKNKRHSRAICLYQRHMEALYVVLC